ncbi:nesprin-3 isoform X2 [Pseudophryne corroboree]|uniref:nesprin-3 isoform X2 n=1 Tax=Pseudophryne corroboree TaxID=495146 RepID=UPI003081A7CE
MTQLPHDDFETCLEKAEAWMKSIHERLKVNDNTQGPRSALESRLRETEKICSLEPDGKLLLDMVLMKAKTLLSESSEDEKHEILVKQGKIKTLFDETITYMTHCHSRIEWVWLHWNEYLRARDEFTLWVHNITLTLEPDVELQLGLKEKCWQYEQALVLLRDVVNQSRLLDRLLEEAASLYNRIGDPSVDESVQSAMMAEYKQIKKKTKERVTRLEKIFKDHEAYDTDVTHFKSWLNTVIEKLKCCVGSASDSTENRLNMLREIGKDVEIGEKQLEALEVKSAEVIRNTSPLGTEKIYKELEELRRTLAELKLMNSEEEESLLKTYNSENAFILLARQLQANIAEFRKAIQRLEESLECGERVKSEDELLALWKTLNVTKSALAAEEAKAERVKVQLKDLFKFSKDVQPLSDEVIAAMRDYQRVKSKAFKLSTETESELRQLFQNPLREFLYWKVIAESVLDSTAVPVNDGAMNQDSMDNIERLLGESSAIKDKLAALEQKKERIHSVLGDDKTRALLSDISAAEKERAALHQDLLQRKDTLQSLAVQSEEFDSVFKALHKQMSAIRVKVAKENELQPDIIGKQAQLQRLQMLLEDLTKLSSPIKALRSMTESNPTQAHRASQLSSDYLMLQRSLENNIRKSKENINNHWLFNKTLQDLQHWIMVTRGRLEAYQDGSKEWEERDIEVLLVESSEKDLQHLQVEAQGQQVIETSSPEGAAAIHSEIQQLIESWDSLQQMIQQLSRTLKEREQQIRSPKPGRRPTAVPVNQTSGLFPDMDPHSSSKYGKSADSNKMDTSVNHDGHVTGISVQDDNGHIGAPGAQGLIQGASGHNGVPEKQGLMQGDSGQKDVPGNQGLIQGASGQKGVPGNRRLIQGDSGQKGVPGNQGLLQGDSGQKGVPGNQGLLQGDSGQKGVPGNQGLIQGASSQKGVPGNRGLIQGDSGQKGVPGMGLIQGASGHNGVPGYQGLIEGDNDHIGGPGIQGLIQGAIGQKGVSGNRGLIQSDSGHISMPGNQGLIQGAIGHKGVPGNQGLMQGASGQNGVPGNQGLMQGASAQKGVPGNQGLIEGDRGHIGGEGNRVLIQGASGHNGVQGYQLLIQGDSGHIGGPGNQGLIQGANGQKGVPGNQGRIQYDSGHIGGPENQGLIQDPSGQKGVPGNQGRIQGAIGQKGVPENQGFVLGVIGQKGMPGNQGLQSEDLSSTDHEPGRLSDTGRPDTGTQPAFQQAGSAVRIISSGYGARSPGQSEKSEIQSPASGRIDVISRITRTTDSGVITAGGAREFGNARHIDSTDTDSNPSTDRGQTDYRESNANEAHGSANPSSIEGESRNTDAGYVQSGGFIRFTGVDHETRSPGRWATPVKSPSAGMGVELTSSTDTDGNSSTDRRKTGHRTINNNRLQGFGQTEKPSSTGHETYRLTATGQSETGYITTDAGYEQSGGFISTETDGNSTFDRRQTDNTKYDNNRARGFGQTWKASSTDHATYRLTDSGTFSIPDAGNHQSAGFIRFTSTDQGMRSPGEWTPPSKSPAAGTGIDLSSSFVVGNNVKEGDGKSPNNHGTFRRHRKLVSLAESVDIVDSPSAQSIRGNKTGDDHMTLLMEFEHWLQAENSKLNRICAAEISSSDGIQTKQSKLQKLQCRVPQGQKLFNSLLLCRSAMTVTEDLRLEDLRYRWMLYKSKLHDSGNHTNLDVLQEPRVINKKSGGLCSFLHRVCSAALPLQLLLLLLLLLMFLLPLLLESKNCALSNNFARSFNLMLKYEGPPPT